MPPPYTSGKTCSACPSSAPKCHDDGLCNSYFLISNCVEIKIKKNTILGS